MARPVMLLLVLLLWGLAAPAESVEDGNETGLAWEVEDGGFGSMEAMLHWAIEHADAGKLKDAAEDAAAGSERVREAQAGIREVLDSLEKTSDAALMRAAIAELGKEGLEERMFGLRELLLLVEETGNANALGGMGGVEALIAGLAGEEAEVRAMAAWVLGTAGQNNAQVQEEVLEAGALPRLMRLVEEGREEEAGKALFAVAALVRDLPQGQEGFGRLGGAGLLQRVIGDGGKEMRLRRKCVQLVGDLADAGMKAEEFFTPDLIAAVVRLAESSGEELDTMEKAILALQSLARLNDEKVRHQLVQVSNAEAALERMERQLMLHRGGELEEFARDVDLLRQSVRQFISSYTGQFLSSSTGSSQVG